MKNRATNKSIIRIALGILVLAAGLCAYGFVTVEVWSAKTSVAAQSDSLATKRAEASGIAQAASLADQTKSERAELSALVLPAQGGDVSFITQVEALATSSGVTARVTAVGGKAPAGTNPGQLALTIQFSGSYAACMRYLELVETLPYASHIETLVLQDNGTSGTSSAGWTGNLTLYVLSLDTPS